MSNSLTLAKCSFALSLVHPIELSGYRWRVFVGRRTIQA
jgi:hypothetical protein